MAVLIAGVALWVEFRPDPLVEHPFAVLPIAAGEPVNELNTQSKRVPAGMFEPLAGTVALREIKEGAPVLASDVGEPSLLVPKGWWTVAVAVPAGANRGDMVRLVLLDTGTVVDGVVATAAATDAFSSTDGAVAVHPDHAGEAAAASINGRVAVLISTG